MGPPSAVYFWEGKMKWVTREKVKVDRVACPWLIKKFIDPQAEFLFVPAAEVLAVAEREKAIPYDVAGARTVILARVEQLVAELMKTL
jgi:hypothetical protein